MSDVDAFLQARDFLQSHGEDYETAYRQFKWPEMTHFNWALDYFDPYAKGNDNLALWVVRDNGETRYTFDEMSAGSARAANYMRQLGVDRGDRILIMLDNVPQLWEIMLGAIKLGAVIIPTSTLLSARDLNDRIGRGNVRHLVAGQAYTDRFDAVGPDVTHISVGGAASGWHDYAGAEHASAEFAPDGPTPASDPMLLYFTSGTTSLPKLVLHTHQSYPVGHLSTMYWIGLKEGDVHWNISSPGWAKHAWSSFFAPWNAGATIFVRDLAPFDPKAALATLEEKGVTTMCGPPTVYRILIQEELNAYKTKLRLLVGAGEPLNPEVISRVEQAWGLTIRDGYGQTETTAIIANPPGQPVRPGATGQPLPGYSVALLDVDGNEAKEGEIALRLGGDHPLALMAGYEGDSERQAKVMDAQYYRTGDVARIDEDGYYWYVGRADDVFKSSDYRISPFELESLLIECEAVAEAAVVPSPDPRRLAVPKAYVVLRQGFEPNKATALQIMTFAREHLAPYQRIRRLEFRELPKTISGKIRRVELREHAGSEDRPPEEHREEDFDELKRG
jgi:acetyl-CoA synthetase